MPKSASVRQKTDALGKSEELYLELTSSHDKLVLGRPSFSPGAFIESTFLRNNENFSCDHGFFVTPDDEFHGGGDGAYGSRHIKRYARKTKSDDLMFYEASYIDGKLLHNYYTFVSLPERTLERE